MISFPLSPIGRLVMAGIAGAAIGFSGAWTVQGWRLDSAKAEHAVFVAKVEALGEQAKANKKLEEAKNEQVLTDVSKAWKGSLDAAVGGAVARYAARVSSNNTGSSPLPREASDPQTPDATGGERLACAPDKPFIEACAADATKIESFQTWAREIGFPVK